MPIRWSALKVKEATDKIEAIVAPVLEPLERAKQVAIEAEKIPNLPDYVKERLFHLQAEVERVTGGIHSWDKMPYKGNIHRVIDAIRESLPKGDLAKEQASFQKWLDLFDGDREKAEVAMGIGKPEPRPKETPKDQMTLLVPTPSNKQGLDDIQLGYNPVAEAIEFFCGTGKEELLPEEESDGEDGVMICPKCNQEISGLDEWDSQPIKVCPKCGNVIEPELDEEESHELLSEV